MSVENVCCDELVSLTEQFENLNSKLREIKLKYQNALVDNLIKRFDYFGTTKRNQAS